MADYSNSNWYGPSPVQATDSYYPDVLTNNPPASGPGAFGPAVKAGGMAGLGTLLAGLGPWAPILFGFGGSLLQGYMADQARKRFQERVKQLMSAGNISKETAAFLTNMIGGAGYQGALGRIAAGANATQSSIANTLASRGLGTSGIGAVMSGLTPSIVGKMQSDLYTKAEAESRQAAMEKIKQEIATLSGNPNGLETALAGGIGVLGRGLEQWAANKYLDHYLYRQAPSATATGQGGQTAFNYGQTQAGSELYAPKFV